jgi:hypothetical protein
MRTPPQPLPISQAHGEGQKRRSLLPLVEIRINMVRNDDPEYMALYEIPIEQLELSENAIFELKSVAIVFIGDCIIPSNDFLRSSTIR